MCTALARIANAYSSYGTSSAIHQSFAAISRASAILKKKKKKSMSETRRGEFLYASALVCNINPTSLVSSAAVILRDFPALEQIKRAKRKTFQLGVNA